MSLEQTRRTINRYFHVMSGGGDLAECYSADVTWTTTETGEELRGAPSVRDYVVALHNNMCPNAKACHRRWARLSRGRLCRGAHRYR